mmetsp:Transcript_36167/g.76018  ORF Transcript_36167/g.76018 Transcript_36167/m.76018 type:complete len:436 (-) Transcript_36167:275-1582(-)
MSRRSNAPPSSPSMVAAFLIVVLLTPATLKGVASASMMSRSPHQLSSKTMRRPHYNYARRNNNNDPCQTTNNLSSMTPQIMNVLRINDVRGGDVGDDDSSSAAPENFNYNNSVVPPPQQQQQMGDSPNFQSPTPPIISPTAPVATSGQYNTLDGNSGVVGGVGTTSNNDPNYEYRETVEDRIDAWRRQQQQLQQSQTAAEAASVVDDQGRFKLFTTVSRVSVSFFFFILMWRTVHHYELADATFGSGRGNNGVGIRQAIVRTVVVTPLVVLFLGEMMGAILGVTGGSGASSGSHATKKRLKGILNLHKGVELVMMFYNVVRLAIWPSKYVMREVYIGRTISNFFFLMQAQLYTKLSWDDVSKSTLGEGGYVTESYYDDYTPEMAGRYDDGFSSRQSTAATGTTGGNNHYGQEALQQQQQQQPYQQNYDDNATGWS